MGYFVDNRKVQFSDLEASGIYSTILMDEVKKGNYHKLKKILDIDTRKDKDFMEPLMYAVKNEKGTYAIYEYYHEKLQNDIVLATEIVRREPELIENTPLSGQKEFILQVALINPRVIAHMSHDLKTDSKFIGELCNLQNEEVTQYAANECKMPEVFLKNPELTGNEIFMMQAILQNVNSLEYVSENLKNDYGFMKNVSKNTEVIDYVVEHTEQFGREGLNATKDALIEISIDEAISGFEEASKMVEGQIIQTQNEEKVEGLDELLKRNKQLQRHIKFFERIQKGEIDPIRAAKLMDKLCQNIEPEYKQKINQLLRLDKAIIERDNGDKRMESLNTGVVVDQISPEQYEKAALDFSEGNARYMRETRPDKKKITEICSSDEFWKTFRLNAPATREMRTKNNNAICLQVEGGSSLSDVAHRIMELHRAGQPVVTEFNTFKIDTRQYSSEQSIVEAYHREIEEYIKSKRMLKSGIEATEESVRTDQINNEVDKIRKIQKSNELQKGTEENTLE